MTTIPSPSQLKAVVPFDLETPIQLGVREARLGVSSKFRSVLPGVASVRICPRPLGSALTNRIRVLSYGECWNAVPLIDYEYGSVSSGGSGVAETAFTEADVQAAHVGGDTFQLATVTSAVLNGQFQYSDDGVLFANVGDPITYADESGLVIIPGLFAALEAGTLASMVEYKIAAGAGSTVNIDPPISLDLRFDFSKVNTSLLIYGAIGVHVDGSPFITLGNSPESEAWLQANVAAVQKSQ